MARNYPGMPECGLQPPELGSSLIPHSRGSGRGEGWSQEGLISSGSLWLTQLSLQWLPPVHWWVPSRHPWAGQRVPGPLCALGPPFLLIRWVRGRPPHPGSKAPASSHTRRGCHRHLALRQAGRGEAQDRSFPHRVWLEGPEEAESPFQLRAPAAGGQHPRLLITTKDVPQGKGRLRQLEGRPRQSLAARGTPGCP